MINFFEMVAEFFITIIGFLKFLLGGIKAVIQLIPNMVGFITSIVSLLPTSLTVAFGTITTLLCIKAVKRWLI